MTVLKQPNPGKQIEININGVMYERFPVQTPLIHKGDDFNQILKAELQEHVKDGDIILVAESVIAISQGRVFKFDEIKYGFWAKTLSRFVTRTPHGIGLGTPQTMQLAINEVGATRILFSAIVSAMLKPFGIKGVFYILAGEKARSIDGPTENTIPPFNTYASLMPKNPEKFAKRLQEDLLPTKVKVIVIDANDLGVNIMGEKDKNWIKLAKYLASDNPLGQSSESTPALLCRKKD